MSTKPRVQEIVVQLRTPYNQQLIAEGKLSKDTPLFSEQQVEQLYAYFAKQVYIDEVAYALHTQDKYADTNDLHQQGDRKADHAHIPIMYREDYERTYAQTAQIVRDQTGNDNFAANFVSASPIKGNVDDKYKYATAVVYLAHENKVGSGRPDALHFSGCKGEWEWDSYTWLYPRADVHIAHSNFTKWEKLAKDYYDKAADKKAAKERKAHELAVLRDIADGKIREYEIDERVDLEDLIAIDRKIPVALRKYVAKMERRAREEGFYKPNVWIWGQSGIAKTTLAIEYCKRHGYSYYIADAGNNPLDNYRGEDVIIFDDFRDCIYNFSTFLRVTNMHAPCRLPARYHNKVLATCKLMIFTSTLSPYTIYGARTDGAEEEKMQLYRRIGTIVHMSGDSITTYKWDAKIREHVPYEQGRYVFDPDKYFDEKKDLIRDTHQGNPCNFVDELKHMTDFWVDVTNVQDTTNVDTTTESSTEPPYVDIDNNAPDIPCEPCDKNALRDEMNRVIQVNGWLGSDPAFARYWALLLDNKLTRTDIAMMVNEKRQMRLTE